jgi:Mn-dependent DtxR family transcriptional regulator
MKVKRAIDRLKVDKLVETDRHGSELTDLGKKELKKKRGGNNKKGG